MNEKQHYEITFIINANIPEDEHTGVVDFVKNLITKNDGDITLEENLGRKKLQYPIKKITKGIFFSLRFNIPSELLRTFEKELSLKQEVLRFLTIKKPAEIKGFEETKTVEEKSTKEAPKEVKKAPVKTKKPKETVKEEEKTEDAPEIKIEEKKEAEEKVEEKKDGNELDEK